jgi:hypothetical protein
MSEQAPNKAGKDGGSVTVVLPSAAFERLSTLERERVESEARETLYSVFNAAHSATGWCGDVMDECWQAGLPVMRETLARLILRTR